MAEVKKKNNETFESLVRRFSKKIQQSGRLIQFRKVSYHRHKQNKTANRAAAARRDEIGKQREWQKKIGKLVEEPRNNRRR